MCSALCGQFITQGAANARVHLEVCLRAATGAADVIGPTFQPAERTVSTLSWNKGRSGWLWVAMQTAMGA